MERAGLTPPEAPWWKGAAVVTGAATAFVFLAGYLREISYYSKLGVPSGDVDFPVVVFMANSIPVLAEPLLVWTVALAVQWARRKFLDAGVEKPGAAAVVVAFAWATVQILAAGGVNSTGSVGRLTMLLVVVLWAALGSKTPPLLRDDSVSGHHAFFAFATVVLVLGAGIFQGISEAADRMDGCGRFPVIDMRPEPDFLDGNETYWLVLHKGGNYFVRGVSPDSGLHIIPDDSVAGATVKGTVLCA